MNTVNIFQNIYKHNIFPLPWSLIHFDENHFENNIHVIISLFLTILELVTDLIADVQFWQSTSKTCFKIIAEKQFGQSQKENLFHRNITFKVDFTAWKFQIGELMIMMI